MTDVVLFGDSAINQVRPMALYRLASHLRDRGITVQPIWEWKTTGEAHWLKLAQKYLSPAVKVVGISTFLLKWDTGHYWGVSNEVFAKRIAVIRKLAPNAKIVVGGDQVTYQDLGSVPHHNLVDMFVRGQGEESLLAIVNSVTSSQRVRTESIVPPATNQQIYPFNDFSTSSTRYLEQDAVQPGESMMFEFARGCVFKCSFCSYDILNKRPGDYTKEISVLREELTRNYNDHGITYYTIVDDLINDSPEKVNMIYELTQSLPFKIQYAGYLRLDLLRRYPDMISKLLDSGLISCFFGIETINDASGRAVGKGLGRRRIDETLAMLLDGWKQQVFVETGLIFGLPQDSAEIRDQTLEWAMQPVARQVIKSINTRCLSIFDNRSSDIDRDPAAFGYKLLEDRGGGRKHWRNALGYTSYQAEKDADDVARIFGMTRRVMNEWPVKIGSFGVPFLLSICPDPEAMKRCLLHDDNTVWKNFDQWQQYIHSLYTDHRARYVNTMLGRTQS